MSQDLSSARWDHFSVDSNDVVFGDDDGVLFVQSSVIENELEAAKAIWKVERKQALLIQAGKRGN